MPSPPSPGADLVDLLRWYAEMGVDLALDEEPHDRLAEAAAEGTRRAAPPRRDRLGPAVARAGSDAVDRAGPPPAREEAAPDVPLAAIRGSAPGAASLSTDDIVVSAREQARSAKSLDELRSLLERFEGCALKGMATQLAFADGNPDSRVMLVGEAPGAEEDRRGLPFVGRAGQLLDRMLAAIGLDRTKVYIANVVPWRPPGNRTPTPQETAVCLPFIRRQIELADPDFLVCLGGASATTLLGLKEGIMRARGRWYDYPLDPDNPAARTIKAVATLHPAYLLRQPALKRLAWRDLRLLKKALDGAS